MYSTADSQPHAIEENLALRPGVHVYTSVPCPTGGGASNPAILLNDRVLTLESGPLSDFAPGTTFDTYDGQNAAAGPDWYALDFLQPQSFNCLEMTTGMPYPDGGWWRSLGVEVRKADGSWQPVTSLQITPRYDFRDTVHDRRPFTTYVLGFSEVNAAVVRLIGQPGGTAQFTSLARIAVYYRDLSRWNPASIPPPPTPYVFRLLPPSSIFQLSDDLIKLTGLSITFPYMQYFLDAKLYELFIARQLQNYRGKPDLWFLIGDSVGWTNWNDGRRETLTVPHVERRLNNTLGQAIAPVLVGGQILGSIDTQFVVVHGSFDVEWHQVYAAQVGIPWHTYLAAYRRSRKMTAEQLEGAAGLMGTIANMIANTAHQNLQLERELARRSQPVSHREIIRRAIDFMQENLEAPIGVADVARTVALSVPYFCTVFAAQTGHTPGDYLSDLRFERAKAYLAHSDLSIMDICTALGYSPSYFSRFFKRRTGLSPSQYRSHASNA